MFESSYGDFTTSYLSRERPTLLEIVIDLFIPPLLIKGKGGRRERKKERKDLKE